MRSNSSLVRLPYPSLGVLFKGRDALLAELRASFQAEAGRAESPVVRVLHGLGGVGKTRAAVEYGWRYAADHSAVFFVDAESAEALSRNLAALAGPLTLDLPEQEENDEEVRQAAVLHWLNGHPGWLLILDSLDSREAAMAAQPVIANLRGGHVLLTGRISEWSGNLAAQVLPVLDLDLDAATQFLLQRTAARRRKTADDEASARMLADRLGGLALAVEQAGAYINHQRLTFPAYLQAWNEQRERVLSWYDDLAMHYPKSVAVTWQTSFDQLTDGGRRLLQRLAWLAPEPIPESLLDVALDTDATLDLREALADLESYSLVTRSADEPTFTVHPLVQEVTRIWSDAGGAGQNPLVEALRWIDSAFVGDPQDVQAWPVLDPLVAHALAVSQHAASAGIDHPTSRLFNQIAVLLLAKARSSHAEHLLRRAIRIDERSLGPDHPDVAPKLSNLAQVFEDANRLVEAEPLMRRALAIDERSLGPTHPNVAIPLNNLAALLMITNRAAEAEPLMRRALAIAEQSFGPDHPTIAGGLNNLAELLRDTNRLAEAEPLMRRALDIDERSLGPDHPNVATRLNNLAQLLQDTNRLAEAEPLMRRALDIDERSLGPDHPDVAIRLNNLAQLLNATHRLAEAEPLLRRAIFINERSIGPDHPNVAVSLNNLAMLLQETDRLTEAEPFMRRALAINERSFGTKHSRIITDLKNLASIVRAGGRSAEADALLDRARAVEEALAARRWIGNGPA